MQGLRWKSYCTERDRAFLCAGAPWQGTVHPAYSTPPSDVFSRKSCTLQLARQGATGPAVELETDDMPHPTEDTGTSGAESCQDLPSERPSERASHVFSAASGSWTVSVSSELPTEAFLSPRLSAPPDTTPAATPSGAESTVHHSGGASESSGTLYKVCTASHISDGHVPDAPTNTAQEQGPFDNEQLGSIDGVVRGSQGVGSAPIRYHHVLLLLHATEAPRPDVLHVLSRCAAPTCMCMPLITCVPLCVKIVHKQVCDGMQIWKPL